MNRLLVVKLKEIAVENVDSAVLKVERPYETTVLRLDNPGP